MAFRVVTLAFFALAFAPVNEAVKFLKVLRSESLRARSQLGTQLKVHSKAEVAASMTTEKALSMFNSMDTSMANQTLISMIKRKFAGTDSNDPTGYAAVDGARTMLNDMMNEAIMNKELETVRCGKYEFNQLKILRELEQGIAFANSEASGARAEMLRAQEVIQVLEEQKIPTNRLELSQHNEKCRLDKAVLEQQLSIVLADIEVMKAILGMVCSDNAAAPSFVQIGAEQGAIVKCVSCMSGKQAAWFRHNRIKPMLAALQSQEARDYVEKNLLEEFDDTAKKTPSRVRTVFLSDAERRNLPNMDIPALQNRFNASLAPKFAKQGSCNEQIIAENSSTYRGCQTETMSGRKCQKWSLQTPHAHSVTAENYPLADVGDHNYCRNPDGRQTIWCYTTDPNTEFEFCEPLLALDAPTGIAKHECVETNACKLGAPNCNKLTDRFLVIMAGIIEKREALSTELSTLETTCARIKGEYETTISTLESQLKEEQTNLATAAKALVENQQLSSQSNQQHIQLSDDYHKVMTECCDNKNAYTSEICALEKIRGELYKLQGLAVFITDCEVSDWVDEECSVSCGGGTQSRSRSILIHPINGTACPPLNMEQSCNPDGCPVNCVVSEWEGWSDCTAECGTGVQTRTREKVVEPANGGDPCPEQSESRECNGFACNANCELADWGEWSLCSKACDGGSEERTKAVSVPARGLGECPHPESEARFSFRTCNDFDCAMLTRPGHETIVCTEMIDLTLIVDGSGSLGQWGWDQSKAMATKLVQGMQGGEYSVNLAVLLFSGPSNWEDYEACTGFDAGAVAPDPTACGMYWIHSLSEDVPSVKTAVEGMSWPARTTLTSLALAEAKSQVINGRPDAKSVVVVITDGVPMSPYKTGKAAEDLKKEARLVWIPVGYGIKDTIEQMKGWASYPWKDNLLEIDTFMSLDTPGTLNMMISEFCSQLL